MEALSHDPFLELLPAIEGYAHRFFQTQNDREEYVAEVVANCFVAYTRLDGKVVTGQTLAYYACRQVCEGRRVGQAMNSRDVCNRKGIGLRHLNDVIARGSDPAAEAAFLIDFPDFVERQSQINRKAIQLLMEGERTADAAHKLGVSPARVSQIRRELYEDWELFTS